MNNSTLRLLAGAIILAAFLIGTVTVQFQKNREFRLRLGALEAQMRALKTFHD